MPFFSAGCAGLLNNVVVTSDGIMVDAPIPFDFRFPGDARPNPEESTSGMRVQESSAERLRSQISHSNNVFNGRTASSRTQSVSIRSPEPRGTAPDIFDDVRRLVGEIKGTARVYLSGQIKDEMLVARH